MMRTVLFMLSSDLKWNLIWLLCSITVALVIPVLDSDDAPAIALFDDPNSMTSPLDNGKTHTIGNSNKLFDGAVPQSLNQPIQALPYQHHALVLINLMLLMKCKF